MSNNQASVRLRSTAHEINGRKRHITVDTLGLPVVITVTPADIQDRGYAGDLADWACERRWLTLRIVSRPKGTKGFVVLPRRWKVEHTIGWCMNAHRTACEYERLSLSPRDDDAAVPAVLRGGSVQGKAQEGEEDHQGSTADNRRVGEVEDREVLNRDEVDDVPPEDPRRPEDPVSQVTKRTPQQQAQGESPREAVELARDAHDDHDDRERDRREHSSERLAHIERRTRVAYHLESEHAADNADGLAVLQPRDGQELAAQVQRVGETSCCQQGSQIALS